MQEALRPRWAKRISCEQIYRLYQNDAAGLVDEALLDEVAYGLLARAEAITTVTRAHGQGILPCAACSEEIVLKTPVNKDTVIQCKCGWEIAWPDYHKSYKGKQLVGGAAQPIIDRAMAAFPDKGTAQEKMRWIDNLIHAFHGELQGAYFRPMAVNFIEGNARKVIDLIFSLANEKNSPAERIAQRDAWMHKLEQSYVSYRPEGTQEAEAGADE